jgi:hypothetical protein
MDNSDCAAKPCFSNTERGKKKFLVEKCGSKKPTKNKKTLTLTKFTRASYSVFHVGGLLSAFLQWKI